MMHALIEHGGVGLAWGFAAYGIVFLALPFLTFANVAVLAWVAWTVLGRARRTTPPGRARRSARLLVEIAFGLINPLVYLVILVPSFPWLRSEGAWFAPLIAAAWLLLLCFWGLRLVGAAMNPESPRVRAGVRGLLVVTLVCLIAYIVKDARLMVAATQASMDRDAVALWTFGAMTLRISPVYLVPLILLWDHLRSTSASRWLAAGRRHDLFLLPDRASRIAVAWALILVAAAAIASGHRRSDGQVRALVTEHRDAISRAAAEYNVEPRLIAAIVYVTHRDQLAPFRDTLERLVLAAWAEDRGDEYGGNQILLNQPLDVSVGLAQIKARTALTASLLATRRTPADLPRPQIFLYRDADPLTPEWQQALPRLDARTPPFSVPAERRAVARALHDTRINLATCALILALYQDQWESADPGFSLRDRPEILATLYQIGFARSRPHAAPRSNEFGRRVRHVFDQPWVAELFPAGAPGRQAARRPGPTGLTLTHDADGCRA